MSDQEGLGGEFSRAVAQSLTVRKLVILDLLSKDSRLFAGQVRSELEKRGNEQTGHSFLGTVRLMEEQGLIVSSKNQRKSLKITEEGSNALLAAKEILAPML